MNTCDVCGHANVPGTLFCEDCGSGLTPDALRNSTGDVSADHAGHASAAFGAHLTTGDVAITPAARDAESFVTTARDAGSFVTTARDAGSFAPAGRFTTGDVSSAGGAVQAAPEPAAVSMAYLIVDSGRRVDVPEKDVAIVGREDMRSGIRPDVDLTLDGASAAGVSRRHCRLLRQTDGWYIEDLMSTNFTVLNGKALTAHTPVRVQDGDDLRLGKLRLKFHEP